MTPHNQEMQYQFGTFDSDNPNQSACRSEFRSLFYILDALPSGPESSVAKRKLLESLDAALRCQAY
jgi:hypothetical protein